MNLPQTLSDTYREYRQGTLTSILLSYFDIREFLPARIRKYLGKLTSVIYYRLLNFLLSKKHLVNGEPTNSKFNRKGKIFSLSYGDILSEWIFLNAPTEYIITLENVDVEEKNINFWARLPSDKRIQFLEDVVIFRCKDRSEMIMLIRNIPIAFATAVGYFEGVKLYSNSEHEVGE